MSYQMQLRRTKLIRDVDLCIVVPCFNEQHGIDILGYRAFLKQSSRSILCFVDDGSTDGTLAALRQVARDFEEKVAILSISRNVGKAEAVRQGILYCNSSFEHPSIAFLDADLSTSLTECVEISRHLSHKTRFVFGSRIMKIGSIIERTRYRFLIGRILATLISLILNLKVYDTQCGCKVFTTELSRILFREKFISKWLFDVELFFRMILAHGYQSAVVGMLEVPLKQWIDKGHSKVGASYFFSLWLDLYRIRAHYNEAQKANERSRQDEKTIFWNYRPKRPGHRLPTDGLAVGQGNLEKQT